ncbi:hypothetical protein B0T10DRAFT_602592 [Thelonectria olida]|uniref:Uncharacterized protein n=1 Tax=Thelonectria olida TaxID=1576542 RepID=A0A9P9AUE6_9HYPO|nr:hypothetical protein B0T10DRAFT_602592 [Thelonectria olida]
MRFLSLACTLLASSSAVLAAPASDRSEACCCCDISSNSIVCEAREKDEGCFCAAVVCPADAPTVWPATTGAATATPTLTVGEPEKRAGDEEECCCCNPQIPAIVCEARARDEGCFCPAVACPTDAPTLTTTMEIATPTTTVTATATAGEEETCCCCEPAAGAVVCRRADLCICAMILCPSDLPTVTVEPGQTATPL